MRVWERKGYIVKEVYFDYDLNAFEIITKDGNVITIITPADWVDMNRIISELDSGEDVEGWEDGTGNTIYFLKEEKNHD